MEKRLYRSRSDRVVWGVCGGLAKYFDMDPTIIRVITLLLIFLGGLGVLAYVILAVVVPLEDTKATQPRDTIKENVEEMKETASELGRELHTALTGKENETEETVAETRRHRRNLLGIVLVVGGALFLVGSVLKDLGIFWWLRWGNLWPLFFVAIGVLIILGTRRK